MERNDTGWWYEYPDGSYPKEEWEKIDGIWYYFNERGYSIASRWLKDDGKMVLPQRKRRNGRWLGACEW